VQVNAVSFRQILAKTPNLAPGTPIRRCFNDHTAIRVDFNGGFGRTKGKTGEIIGHMTS
jgi:hypothetical protein